MKLLTNNNNNAANIEALSTGVKPTNWENLKEKVPFAPESKEAQGEKSAEQILVEGLGMRERIQERMQADSEKIDRLEKLENQKANRLEFYNPAKSKTSRDSLIVDHEHIPERRTQKINELQERKVEIYTSESEWKGMSAFDFLRDEVGSGVLFALDAINKDNKGSLYSGFNKRMYQNIEEGLLDNVYPETIDSATQENPDGVEILLEGSDVTNAPAFDRLENEYSALKREKYGQNYSELLQSKLDELPRKTGDYIEQLLANIKETAGNGREGWDVVDAIEEAAMKGRFAYTVVDEKNGLLRQATRSEYEDMRRDERTLDEILPLDVDQLSDARSSDGDLITGALLRSDYVMRRYMDAHVKENLLSNDQGEIEKGAEKLATIFDAVVIETEDTNDLLNLYDKCCGYVDADLQVYGRKRDVVNGRLAEKMAENSEFACRWVRGIFEEPINEHNLVLRDVADVAREYRADYPTNDKHMNRLLQKLTGEKNLEIFGKAPARVMSRYLNIIGMENTKNNMNVFVQYGYTEDFINYLREEANY